MKYTYNQRGFIYLPILIIGILAITLTTSGYFGYNQFKNYQIRQIEKEQQIQKQQEVLEETQKEIAKLKSENKQTKSELQKTAASIQRPSKKLTNKEIIANLKPATVYIETKNSAGSGMILSRDGFILTNAHVVSDVLTVIVKLSDKRSLTATVIGRDENIDLAILKIGGDDFVFVELGDSDAIEQGDEVFALGYPFGLEGDVSFKEGTISRRVSVEDINYLEISADILPGNSGGPLANKYGQVIGVNTAMFGKSIKGISLGETLKFSIPINIAKTYIPNLKAGVNNFLSRKTTTVPSNPKQSIPKTVSFEEQEYNRWFDSVKGFRNKFNAIISLYNNDQYEQAISELESIVNNEQSNLTTFGMRLSQYGLPFSGSVANTGLLRSNTISYMKAVLRYEKDILAAEKNNNWSQAINLYSEINNLVTQMNSSYRELKQKEDEVISSATNYFN